VTVREIGTLEDIEAKALALTQARGAARYADQGASNAFEGWKAFEAQRVEAQKAVTEAELVLLAALQARTARA
jgi:hypothetical protein